jgi:hypothetical protein
MGPPLAAVTVSRRLSILSTIRATTSSVLVSHTTVAANFISVTVVRREERLIIRLLRRHHIFSIRFKLRELEGQLIRFMLPLPHQTTSLP